MIEQPAEVQEPEPEAEIESRILDQCVLKNGKEETKQEMNDAIELACPEEMQESSQTVTEKSSVTNHEEEE